MSELALSNVVNFKIPTMLTIKEAAKATKMAEFYIRGLCIENKIVHVRCGKKYLVNLEKFIEYLNTSLGLDDTQPDNVYKLKPIS